jgi:hypothetical protein
MEPVELVQSILKVIIDKTTLNRVTWLGSAYKEAKNFDQGQYCIMECDTLCGVSIGSSEEHTLKIGPVDLYETILISARPYGSISTKGNSLRDYCRCNIMFHFCS